MPAVEFLEANRISYATHTQAAVHWEWTTEV